MSSDDELNEMLEKYRAPAEAAEEIALEAAALHLSFEFNPPSEDDSGGEWFRNLYFSKKTLAWYRKHKDRFPAGVIEPQFALIDLDPKKVAAKISERYKHSYRIDRCAEILEGLPRVIDWLVRFEQALREEDEDGDEEVEGLSR